jgi:hypothetical protein
MILLQAGIALGFILIIYVCCVGVGLIVYVTVGTYTQIRKIREHLTFKNFGYIFLKHLLMGLLPALLMLALAYLFVANIEIM